MSQKPAISVIVPAYNEAQRIASCIDALQRQTIEFPYEIIVSDNCSVDQTADIAHALGVRVISTRMKGYVHALRQGAQSAWSDIIAITDADCLPPTDWLARIYNHFMNSDRVVAVGGPFGFYDGPTWVRRTVHVCNMFHPHLMTASLCGMNMAFRKNIYNEIGGFDEGVNLQTDTQLGFRLMREGTVIFDRSLVMWSSGRRYQSFDRVLSEVALRITNATAIRLTGKPVLYAFADVRS